MKKDTITITRAEYAHLNKAANAAVEHALELVQAARLVDDLQARIVELQAEGEELLEENKKLLLEKASLKEKNAMMRSHIDLVETYLEMLQDSITNAMTGARIGGDYKSNMEWLVETAKKYKL